MIRLALGFSIRRGLERWQPINRRSEAEKGRSHQPANRMTMPIWATASKTVTKLLSKVSMLGIRRIGWGASQDLASAGLFSAGRVVSF